MSSTMEEPRAPRRWVRESVAEATPRLPLGLALRRGIANRCPVCGEAPIFAGYLRVVPACAHCGTPLGQLRADDAPPYITLLIVCHLVVGSLVGVERAFAPPIWVEVAIFVPLTAALILGLLRPVKGCTVGIMLAMGLLRAPDA